jgi:hypothetical protein
MNPMLFRLTAADMPWMKSRPLGIAFNHPAAARLLNGLTIENLPKAKRRKGPSVAELSRTYRRLAELGVSL